MSELPITMVTAMVSPRARARARKMEPNIPERAYGTTTCQVDSHFVAPTANAASRRSLGTARSGVGRGRSEEHTSELQSHLNIVCRLLLEKKKRECVQDRNSS